MRDTRNPIRKFVSGGSVSMHVGGSYRAHRTWGYSCECGESAHHQYYGRKMATRKQARDAYHRHLAEDHGGPGWVPDRRGADPASPSPRQGLAETLAERDDSVGSSTLPPATTPVPSAVSVGER